MFQWPQATFTSKQKTELNICLVKKVFIDTLSSLSSQALPLITHDVPKYSCNDSQEGNIDKKKWPQSICMHQ